MLAAQGSKSSAHIQVQRLQALQYADAMCRLFCAAMLCTLSKISSILVRENASTQAADARGSGRCCSCWHTPHLRMARSGLLGFGFLRVFLIQIFFHPMRNRRSTSEAQ